jgi:hypothetical protein
MFICKSSILLLTLSISGCMVVPIAMEYPVTTASAGVFVATGKGPTDHALSYVTSEDCNTIHLVINTDKPVCEKLRGPAPVIDHSRLYSSR